MNQIKITRVGNVIGLSSVDDSPLDGRTTADIQTLAQYTHLTYSQDDHRCFPETRYMVSVDSSGRLLTTIGLQHKLMAYLSGRGYTFVFSDKTPPDKDAIQLQPQWDAISDVKFRPRQEECLRMLTQAPCGIVEAFMGFGKTFLIKQLIRLYPTARFHISTKQSSVLNDIYRDLLEVTPNVGRVGGGYDDPDKRITVVNADSLHKAYGNKADFLLFDECHRAAAGSYFAKIMRAYKYSRNYGFSGTPDGRSDKAGPLLEMVFGPRLFKLEYTESESLDLVVPLEVHWLTCDKSPANPARYKLRTAKYRQCIWRNDYRNKLLVDYLRTEHSESKVLILVETLEHGLFLQRMLPEFIFCYGIMSADKQEKMTRLGLLPEGYVPLKPKDKTALAEAFRSNKERKAIATGVWVEGVSFDDLEVVVLASGSSAMIPTLQGSGRVSRVFDNKFKGKVVDFMDTFGTYFSNKSAERRRLYTKQGWNQYVIGDR